MLILASTVAPASPLPVQRARTLKRLSQTLDTPGQGWFFRARAAGAVKQPIPRGAVLTFQFYDVQGRIVDYADSGFTYSDGLKSRFLYVPVETAPGAGIRTKPLLPPSGAVRLECQLQLWQGPQDVQLATELALDSYEYTLADLAGFERTSPRDAERVAERGLTLHSKERQYLLDIQSLAWRIGAPALLAKACQLLEAAPDVRGYMRNQSRYAMAALSEVENGIPDPGRAASPHKRLPHRIAHLAPAAGGSALALAHSQFDRGMRPLLLVPSEYASQSEAGGPYSTSQDGGSDIVELSALSPKACRGVPRPDLLRFDVMLAELWLRRMRIGLLHAHVGRSGYDLALRALALGRRLHLPVVMNWHAPENPYPVADATCPPPGSAWAETAYRRQLRCAAQADAVIVTDSWQAWQLDQAGVPADRVFVIPRMVAMTPAASTSPPGRGKKPWTALIDVRGVPLERVTALASALPAAIGRKSVQLRIDGDTAAMGLIENALRVAGMHDLLVAPASNQAPAVLIRLRPQTRPDRPEWLTDLDDLACSDTLMLAESTPQSEHLVRGSGLGLTFDLGTPATLAEAFTALSPSRPDGSRLRRNLRAQAAMQTNAEALAGLLDHAYHRALRAFG